MNKQNKKTMRDVGERKFLQEIAHLVDSPILDFNDDASAILISENTVLVINADMLVKQTDVLPGMTYRQLGSKAISMSVSDIVAKGVEPIGCLTSLAIPADVEVESSKEIIRGIKDQCSEYNIKFLGGDLNQGNDIIIDAISFGTCQKKSLIPRKGAKKGDNIYVTGYFGLTYLGFMNTIESKILPKEIESLAVDSVYNPKAKIQYLSLLQNNNVKICMDSSDGLIVTLTDLSILNKLGIEVTDVPIHPKLLKYLQEENLNPLDLVFGGGEEFELVFSISPEDENLLIKEAEERNLFLLKIGKFTDQFTDIRVTQKEYQQLNLPRNGYEHFK